MSLVEQEYHSLIFLGLDVLMEYLLHLTELDEVFIYVMIVYKKIRKLSVPLCVSAEVETKTNI